ncbi:MAG: hypothetical protein KDA96_06240 [Planctomycetaceae bacterium]|nr:hypothetical protein [Planctomycetaceae bacterium]
MLRECPNQDAVRIREIDWRQTFPLLRLIEGARIAFSLQTMVPLIALMGLWMIGRRQLEAPMVTVADPWEMLPPIIVDTGWWVFAVAEWFDRLLLGSPAVASPLPLHACVYPVLLNLTVLSLAALMTGRITALQVCRGQRGGMLRSSLFALTHFRRMAASLVILLLVLCVSGAGLSMARWVATASWLEPIRILVLPVLWMSGFVVVAAWLTIGLAVGLVPAGIAVDHCHAADAVSRSLNYVLSHRAWTVISLLAAVACQRVFLLVITWLFRLVADIAWHGGIDSTEPRTMITPAEFGELLIQVITGAVQMGLTFSTLTIIYLLLRQKEDGVRFTEMEIGP